jgi:hypothetical protein
MPRNHHGSALAEFAPGLTFLLSFFLVVVSIGWYLMMQVALRDVCDRAVAKASACFGAEQSGLCVAEVDRQFRSGPIGLLIDNNSKQDGMSMRVERAAADGAGITCRVLGTYHVKVLFCPWLIGLSADATRVLEHPEGYKNVARSH